MDRPARCRGAAAVAARCCLVRSAHEVWASASFGPPGASVTVEQALEIGSARWQLLADAVQCDTGAAVEARTAMLDPLGTESWRVDISSVGWKKPRTLAAKIALMEKLDELLGPLPGEVELAAPRHVLAMLEDCREAEPPGGWAAAPPPEGVQPPSHLFLTRQVRHPLYPLSRPLLTALVAADEFHHQHRPLPGAHPFLHLGFSSGLHSWAPVPDRTSLSLV